MPEAKKTGNAPADSLQHAFEADLSPLLGGASDSLQPEVQAILKAHPEFTKEFILDKSEKKTTLLIEAIKHGDAPDATRAILSAVPEKALKEYINQKDEYGNSPLYYAVHCMPDIAVELLHKDTDTHHLTPNDENLLHVFAADEYPVRNEALKEELKKPKYADLLNEQNRLGDLPLHAARTPEAVTFLLKDLHANAKALNADYKSAPAMLVGQLNGMDIELSYFKNNAPSDFDRITPYAPRWNEAARISTLIAAHAEAGVDLGREKRMEALGDMFHFTEYEKNTKIFSAAPFADAHERILKAQEEMNKARLDEVMKSADKDALNRKDEYYCTPLYYAMRYQRFDDAEKLIKRGAHLTDLDENKDNIYHLAALYADDSFSKSTLPAALKNHPERDVLLAQRNYFPDVRGEDCDLPAKDCQSVAAVKFFLEIQPPPVQPKEHWLEKLAHDVRIMPPAAVAATPETDQPNTMFDEVAWRLSIRRQDDMLCDILLAMQQEHPDGLQFHNVIAMQRASAAVLASAHPQSTLSDADRKSLHLTLVDKAMQLPSQHAVSIYPVIENGMHEAIRTNDIAFLKSLRPAFKKNGMLQAETASRHGGLTNDEVQQLLYSGNADMLNELFDAGLRMNTMLIALDKMNPPFDDDAARALLSRLHGKLNAQDALPMAEAIKANNLAAIRRYLDFDLVYPPGEPSADTKTMSQLAQEKFYPGKKKEPTTMVESYEDALQRGYDQVMQSVFSMFGIIPFNASKGNELTEIMQKLLRYDFEYKNRLYSEQHNISKAEAAPGPVAMDMPWNTEEFRPQPTLPLQPKNAPEKRYLIKNTI